MERLIRRNPISSCIIIFAICGLARSIEYFVIRTDETVIAENFLHKVFGIIVLAVVLYALHGGWQSIGFIKNEFVSGIAKGLILGGGCFAAAYTIECLILYCVNQEVSLAFYVSGFTLSGESVKHNGGLFLALCIVCNVINVWMEEGVFRGLFMNLLEEKMSFTNAALLIALLFGLWHWVMPLRDYMDGNASIAVLGIMGFGYIILAGIMSIKWSILYQMTGSLWMGLGDHLFNNVVVTNLLHVLSSGEADSMQIVRIMIGQMLSFAIVLLYYKKVSKPAK